MGLTLLSRKLPYTGGGGRTTFLFFPRGVVVTISSPPITTAIGFSDIGSAKGSAELSDRLREELTVLDPLREPCQSRCRASRALLRRCSITNMIALWRNTPIRIRMKATASTWNTIPRAAPVTASTTSAHVGQYRRQFHQISLTSNDCSQRRDTERHPQPLFCSDPRSV